uniref:Uncharacterized protein n=1 Tax=Zea mays TaxID=4577 RepID=A0A804Q422_MAIZE
MQGSTKAGSVEGWILFVGLDPWRECTALVAQLEVRGHVYLPEDLRSHPCGLGVHPVQEQGEDPPGCQDVLDYP